MKKNVLIGLSLFALPVLLLAEPTVVSTLGEFGDILNVVKNIIFALAFIGFFWGLLQWIFADGEKKSDGKTIMLWSILALFIMFSIWGIIAILQNSFPGTEDGPQNTPDIPQVY